MVSSRVLSSTHVGERAKDRVTIVEVPVMEEMTKCVNVRRLIEREKHVPKINRAEVKKTVEVPKIKIVQKSVEVGCNYYFSFY